MSDSTDDWVALLVSGLAVSVAGFLLDGAGSLLQYGAFALGGLLVFGAVVRAQTATS